MYRLLVIEDDPAYRKLHLKKLTDSFELEFVGFSDDIIRKVTQKHFDAVLLDEAGNAKQLFQMLHSIKKQSPSIQVIITSETEQTSTVVQAIKQGAFDFIAKPFKPEKLIIALQKALEHTSLKHEIACLRRTQDVIYDIDRIIAFSPAMDRVISHIRRFSRSDSTILMTGESGTGKSFLSGTIHYNSNRRNRPFVKINCANIQETLLESELFGHEKGAFTSAEKLRIGRFEQANGGTIFLDEIGEMSLGLQSKVLRVLEEKSFERLGGNRTIESDVRIIAATNKNLDRLVKKGEFREDLFYRINVLPIHIPPLRERRECLEPLAYFLHDKISLSLQKHTSGFTQEVIDLIYKYHWPGNIRQLSNTIERAILLEESAQIQAKNFLVPRDIATPPSTNEASLESGSSLPLNLKESEKEQIVQALEKTLWIQKDAAKLLGISPRVLNHKIKRLGITHHRWRKFRGSPPAAL